MSNPTGKAGAADTRRFKLIPVEELTPEQKTVANAIRSGPRAGERGVVDLIAVNGFYGLVSMALNVDGTPLPAGEKLPLPPLS